MPKRQHRKKQIEKIEKYGFFWLVLKILKKCQKKSIFLIFTRFFRVFFFAMLTFWHFYQKTIGHINMVVSAKFSYFPSSFDSTCFQLHRTALAPCRAIWSLCVDFCENAHNRHRNRKISNFRRTQQAQKWFVSKKKLYLKNVLKKIFPKGFWNHLKPCSPKK